MYHMNDINELYQELSDNRENFNLIVPDLFARAAILHKDGIQNLFMKILSNLVVSISEFQLMVDLGADPGDSNFYAFDMVAMTNKMELAKYIIDNYDINLQDHRASLADCVGGMKYEIFQLVYPDAESITDRLIKNCLDDLEKVKLLVSYGIEVERIINICAELQSLSLNFYRNTGKYLIDSLVEKSFITTPSNKNLYFVLKDVLFCGVLEKRSVEQLISLGIDFKQNKLLANICAHNNNLEIVSFLINDGYYDGNDGSALEHAIQFSCTDIAKLLFDHNIAITDNSVSLSLSKSYFLILLYQHGVSLERIIDIAKKHSQGSKYICLETLKFLAENGVDLNCLVLDC